MACSNKKFSCKTNNGFTLIELLVVVAILVVFVSLISAGVGGCSAFSKPVVLNGTVTDKWTDMDGDGDTVYRCRTSSPNGEVNTYNSYWVHNQITVNGYYRFTVKGNMISTVESAQPPQQAEQNVNQ